MRAFPLLLGAAFASWSAEAADFSKEISSLLTDHKLLAAARADVARAGETAKAAWGDWYPDLSSTSHAGHEHTSKPDDVNTNLPSKYADIKITQQLWDFGSSNSKIHQADLTLLQAQAGLINTTQTLLLSAVTAHLELLKAYKVVDFAKGSVDNIKRQTELESSLVERGGGIATDVLQAKTQLAAAESRHVRAQGTLKNAINRYNRVFGHFPDDLKGLTQLAAPVGLLPESLDASLDLASKDNPQVKAASLSAQIAEAQITQARADGFLPQLNLVGSSIYKEDYAGTNGSRTEHMIKAEMTYSLDLGLTAINTLKATEEGQSAAVSRYGATLDDVQEAVRNAWDNYETARLNLEHLQNQTNIANEFLELARRERGMGNRSLIDVLSGETALINASADAAAAETDVAIAGYTLLAALGQLNETSFAVE